MDLSPSERCATAARASTPGLAGTAICRTSFLLIDWPLPWPSALEDIAELHPLLAAIDRARSRSHHWRVQLVARHHTSARRVTAHRLPEGLFRRYHSAAWRGRPHEVVDRAVELVNEAGQCPDLRPTTRESILICTHGRRDLCCGSDGTALWSALAGTPLAQKVDLERTSHLGGHRFAPTALHLPTGTMWGWLDHATIEHIINRDAPFATVATTYRGSTALATPAEQLVETKVLETVGWSWLENRRSGHVIDVPDGKLVELRYSTPDGDTGQWSAMVEQHGEIPIPPCRNAPPSGKSEPLERIADGSLTHHLDGSDADPATRPRR